MSGQARRGARGHMFRGRAQIFRRFFLSVAPDVIGLLVAQGEVSLEALDAFGQWSNGGGPPEAERIPGLEHAADDARHTLLGALRAALATPIDREDVYILSERCDRVVNAARDIAAEADALGWVPDQHAATMAHHLREGMARLVEGFAALRANPDRSGAAASGAVREVRAVENVYRSAMAELLGVDDLRVVFTAREIYRSYARTGGLVVAVADRLWYAVLSQV